MSTTYRINLTSAMKAEVTVTREGDVITATVGRKATLSVAMPAATDKLVAMRDKARADQSAVEVDPCDGYRSPVRSQASLVEEAQMVALLRHLGVTADTPDAYAVTCARDYAERVNAPHALPLAAREAQAILAALATASRDETFGLLARASWLYNSDWVSPTWQAAQAAAVAAAAAAETQRVNNLPDDPSWGYAHGGTD